MYDDAISFLSINNARLAYWTNNDKTHVGSRVWLYDLSSFSSETGIFINVDRALNYLIHKIH